MQKNITLGQYYKADSIIHELDPRVKLLATLAFVVLVFVSHDFIGYALMFLLVFLVVKISKVPFSYTVRGLRPVIIILLICAGVNVLFTGGEHMLFEYGALKISAEGIRLAIYLALRLVLIVLGCSQMTFSTTPNDLSAGLEVSLSFLKKIKVPVHEMAMMMSIALRFIPILASEAEKIMKAQMARGASFDEGSIIDKAKSVIPVIIPLFVAAFRRAEDLAQAMDARCYNNGEGRTRLHPLKHKQADYKAYAVIGVVSAAIIILSIAVRFIPKLSLLTV